ncbi:restriction endonuclease subunit S [Blastococcus sp. SYSU DS0973]
MKVLSLGDLAEFVSGFAFKSSAFNTDGVGLPLVRIRDVVPGRSSTYYSGEYDPRFLVSDGDYLIGMDGEFNLARWRGGPALLNQRVCKIAGLDPSLDLGYLVRFLPKMLKKIENATPFATVKHLSVKSLRSIEIPLPPLADQRRIATVLSRAESLRANRQETLDHFGDLGNSIYLEMFAGTEWPRRRLVDLCATRDDIRCGPFGTQLQKSEFREAGVPLWGIKNVNARFELPAWEFVAEATADRLSQYSIIPGDIVMTRKGTIGNCSVYPSHLPLGIMHSDLLRLRMDPDRVVPEFLAHQLHESREIATQIHAVSSGAVMPGINVTKLKELQVRVPPRELQEQFVERLGSVDRQRHACQRQADAFSELHAALVDRAFAGQL